MAALEVVVDTSVVIDFLRGHQPTSDLFSSLLKSRSVGITAITVFELYVGIQPDSQRDKKLTRLVDYLAVLPLNSIAARKAGEIERQLRRRGQTIGIGDVLIAGTCIALDFPLATLNREHFQRVPGLRLYESWC